MASGPITSWQIEGEKVEAVTDFLSSGSKVTEDGDCHHDIRRRLLRLGFDPWAGKIPGEGNGNPFQYFCLENSMDRGAWRAAVHSVAELDVAE